MLNSRPSIVICYLFISSLCAWQVFYISLEYFRYAVFTSVAYEMKEKVTGVPAITICSREFLRSKFFLNKKPMRTAIEAELFAHYNSSLPLCVNNTKPQCEEECEEKFGFLRHDFKCTFYSRGFLLHELIANITLSSGMSLKDHLYYDLFFWANSFCYTINNRIPALDRASASYIWKFNLILEYLLMTQNQLYFVSFN